MTSSTKRSILRGIHMVFALPFIGFVYGPPEEVQQYAYLFRFVFFPALVLTGFWMWKGHAIRRLFTKSSAPQDVAANG